LSRYQVRLIIDGVVFPTTATVSTIEETGDLTIPKAIRYKGDKQMQYDIEVLYGRNYRTLAIQLQAVLDKAPEIEDEILNLTTVISDELESLENAVDYKYDVGFDEGFEQGFDEGLCEGEERSSDAYDEGFNDGHAEGYAEGLEAGLDS
jgi:flagellar biosynthesis/type III secretory pathway protein FliH